MKLGGVWLILASLLALAGPVRAGEAGARHARAIAPFVDDQAVLVARVDLDRVAPQKITEWLIGLGFPVDEVSAAMATASQPLNAIKGAGAHELYAIVSPAYLPQKPIIIVVPLSAQADAGAIASLLKEGWGTAEQIRGAVCAGPEASLERLRKMAPVRRPLLEQAFAEAGEGMLQTVATLTADQRRVIEETLPELPAEIGGGPSIVLTRGALWASASIDLPPRLSASVVVQAGDEAAARQLRALVERVLEVFGRMDEVRRMVPNYDQVARTLMPEAAGDRLVLSVEARQIDMHVKEWFSAALSLVGQARDSTQSRRNVHNIFLACMMYASDHGGEWPDTLAPLAEKGYLTSEDFLRNPARPDLEIGYAYRKPARDAAPGTVVFHEKHEQWPRSGVTVGSRDGAVMLVKDEERFKEILESGR